MHMAREPAGLLARRALIVFALALLAALLWHLRELLVLAFGGILLAIGLCALGRMIAGVTRLPPRLAYWVSVIALLVLLGGVSVLMGSRVAHQLGELTDTVQAALARTEAWLDRTDTGRTVMQLGSRTASGGSVAHLAGVASGLVKLVTYAGVMLFVGLFLGAEPQLYRRGLLSLVPGPGRERTSNTLDALALSLTHWLGGVLISMACVGSMTMLGLALLKIPLAVSLGLLAGVLEFIPYVGPLLSASPAALVALTLGPAELAEVLGLFLLVHVTEGYVLVPLIQRWAVALPPALAIFSVAGCGMLFGPVGLIFAHPLTVALITLVRCLYLDGANAQTGNLPGRSAVQGADAPASREGPVT